jgi:cation diffusion facilitator family transporter
LGEAGRWSVPAAEGRIFIEPTLETHRRVGKVDTEGAVRNAKNLSEPMKSCVKVALLSCLVNGFLMSAKYFLGEVSGSMALKADAVHSLADVVSSLSILGGILISDRKTKTFPLGLYKVENLVSLASSFFIFFAAYEIASEAMYAGHTGAIKNLGPVTAGVVFTVIVAYLYSRYELKAGLTAGSPSLVADAKHIATDMFSSLVILVAIVGTHLGFPLDRYAAILVVALVVYMGLAILIGSLKVLLDATLDYAALNAIRAVLANHSHVKSVTSLGGRSSGRYKFVEANVKVDARLLRDAHAVISHLEEDILDRWPDIDRILIHYEPEQKDSIYIAAPVNAPEEARSGLGSVLSEHFGEAPLFAVLKKEMRTGNVAFETFVPNRFRHLERHRGVKAAELLLEMGIDEVWTRAALDGKGAGYALEALGIEVVNTEATTLRELQSEIAEDSDGKVEQKV